MKKSDIHVGETYSNGKEGRFHSERRVLAEGDFLLYPGQEDNDCLKYEVVAGRNEGTVGNITRTSFASWAKQRVTRSKEPENQMSNEELNQYT